MWVGLASRARLLHDGRDDQNGRGLEEARAFSAPRHTYLEVAIDGHRHFLNVYTRRERDMMFLATQRRAHVER